MLNRRHIRAKVMQVLFSNKSNVMHEQLNNNLEESMKSMYKLYLLMLSMLIKLRHRAIEHQKKAKNKFIKTNEDEKPSMRFVNNIVLKKLDENSLLGSEFENHEIFYWEQDKEYIELIYKDLVSSDLYKTFLKSKDESLKSDIVFVIEFFKSIIAPNVKLYDYLQDKNITWGDDFPVVNTFLVKLLAKVKLKSKQDFFTPNLFKDEHDENFGFKLLKKTLQNGSSYNEEIILKTKNWDIERIANIDFVLLQMAICEFQEFPSIPTKVTINEYIELAKDYSTPKSNVFINGILDKIEKEYRNNKTLNKKGRGLI